MEIDQEIAEILAPLRTKRNAFVSELAEVNVRRAELTEQIRRIDRALSPWVEKPEGKPSSNGNRSRGNSGISEERMDQLRNWVTMNGQEGFTARQAATALSFNVSGIRAGLERLREERVVRKAGVQQPDGAGKASTLWRPVEKVGKK